MKKHRKTLKIIKLYDIFYHFFRLVTLAIFYYKNVVKQDYKSQRSIP